MMLQSIDFDVACIRDVSLIFYVVPLLQDVVVDKNVMFHSLI